MQPASALTISFVLWIAVVLSALVCLVWAGLARTRKRAALVAVCLWCAVAGGTVSGALWGAMTEANAQFQRTKIARLPIGAPARAVDLQPMKMLQFFVSLEQFGRRWAYLTVILPLAAPVWLLRSASVSASRTKDDKPAPDDEFFRPS